MKGLALLFLSCAILFLLGSSVAAEGGARRTNAAANNKFALRDADFTDMLERNAVGTSGFSSGGPYTGSAEAQPTTTTTTTTAPPVGETAPSSSGSNMGPSDSHYTVQTSGFSSGGAYSSGQAQGGGPTTTPSVGEDSPATSGTPPEESPYTTMQTIRPPVSSHGTHGSNMVGDGGYSSSSTSGGYDGGSGDGGGSDGGGDGGDGDGGNQNPGSSSGSNHPASSSSTGSSGKCGGNCPGGACGANCPCGSKTSATNIAQACGMFAGWNQQCCICIVTHESGGNLNAMNKNPNGSYDVGLWQINSINWAHCNSNTAPCTLTSNLNCAKQVWAAGHNSFKLWSTSSICGGC